MIHLDTNFLIQSLIPGNSCAIRLHQWLSTNKEVEICTIVWSEFRCGPIGPSELVLARQIFPSCVPFLTEDAERSADLFNRTGRRSRSLADCQIASIALRRNAGLATVNTNDFKIFQRYGLQLM
jgi:predicted nucleic acid-binding protein